MFYVKFSLKRLRFSPKWSISTFQPILAVIFVTIATVKVELIRDFYTLVIVLISKNSKNKLVKIILLYFSLRGGGGGKSPLINSL